MEIIVFCVLDFILEWKMEWDLVGEWRNVVSNRGKYCFCVFNIFERYL